MSYSTLHDAFNSGDIAELDRMADEINKSKKEQLEKSIKHDISKSIKDSQKSITTLKNMMPSQYFSTQGDFSLSDNDKYSNSLYDLQTNGSTKTMDQLDIQSIQDSINNSNLSISEKDRIVHEKNNKKNKEYYKKIKHLADTIKTSHHDNDSNDSSASSDSMEDTLDHLKNCHKCRRKLSQLLKNQKTKHLFNDHDTINYKNKAEPVPQIIYQQTEQKNDGGLSFFSKLEFKDMLFIVLIIVVIILIIDMIRS